VKHAEYRTCRLVAPVLSSLPFFIKRRSHMFNKEDRGWWVVKKRPMPLCLLMREKVFTD
jgi:hypothetical protein